MEREAALWCFSTLTLRFGKKKKKKRKAAKMSVNYLLKSALIRRVRAIWTQGELLKVLPLRICSNRNYESFTQMTRMKSCLIYFSFYL